MKTRTKSALKNARIEKQLKNQLTTNQQVVYDSLLTLGRSAGAYELLSRLKNQGINAAATVYRALNELTRKGLVQRIVSTRKFIAHQSPKTNDDEILLICQQCGEVSTIEDKRIIELFDNNLQQSGFHVNNYHMELMISCGSCLKSREKPNCSLELFP